MERERRERPAGRGRPQRNGVLLGLVLLVAAAAGTSGAGTGPEPQAPATPPWVRLGPIESEPPLRFGQQKQLLVDFTLLADAWRVRRVQERVRKHPRNPVLEADAPWEQDARTGYGIIATSALRDGRDGLYKVWYSLEPKAGGSVVAYAVSRDGVAWTKPPLGLVDYGGTRQNNVCRAEPFGTPLRGTLHVIRDTRSGSPERRFEAIGLTPLHEDGTAYGGWAGVGASADGATWTFRPGGVREGSGGGNPSCLWDEAAGRYVLFHRQLTENAFPGYRHRFIVRQESRDLETWSGRRTVFNPGVDPEWPEVESMMVFRHEGIYFGLAQMLENEVRGEVELHLLTSRDGLSWEHPFPRQAFIPRGPRGDFDDMITWFGQAVVDPEEIRFYYTGTRYPHSKTPPPIVDDGGSRQFNPGGKVVEYRPNKVGLASVPLDRLIGLKADEPIGAILTRPFVVEGEDLYVNADVDRELRVEVVDAAARLVDSGRKSWIGHYISGQETIVPGFALADCPAVAGSSLAHRVRWKGGSIGKLKGQAVRLRILARMGTIWAFQVR